MALNQLPDAVASTQQYLGQVYRLALLVTGNATTAAERTIAAFSSVPFESTGIDLALARALLPAQQRRQPRTARWQWRADTTALERAGLSAADAQTLLTVFASANPETRLLLGLHMLWGLTPAEAGAALHVAPTPLYALQAAAARAVGFVPPDATTAQIERVARLLGNDLAPDEALAVRGEILSDPQVRAIRDGVLRIERTLQGAVPALFAALPPPDLAQRVEAAVALHTSPIEKPAVPLYRKHPRVLTTAVVLLLIGAFLVVPVASQQIQRATVAPTALASPGALVEAAIHRLDRPLLQQGVMHEVYTATLNGRSWKLERWYDYGEPHRFSVQLREGTNDAIVYGVATDGQGRVQYRTNPGALRGGQAVDLDIALPSSEIASLIPILRQQPDATFFNMRNLPDLSRFYLAQARTALPTALGTTTVAGRAAQIVGFDTEQALPAWGRNQPAPSPSRVLLTIDSATAALLDVTVLPQSTTESTAVNPWHVTQFEVRDTAPDTAFALPGTTATKQTSLADPRALPFFNTGLLTLQDALNHQQAPIYAPQELPENTTRNLAITIGSSANSVVLVYEGEFSSVLISPASLLRQRETINGPEHTVGAFSYRLGSLGPTSTSPISVAQVTRLGSDESVAHVYLLNQYATPQEREAQIQRVVGSLEPITTANVADLSRAFYRPRADGE